MSQAARGILKRAALGLGVCLLCITDLLANWDVEIEYPSYKAMATQGQAKVVLLEARRASPQYLRMLCQRSLSLPYQQDLEAALKGWLNVDAKSKAPSIKGTVKNFKYTVDDMTANCTGKFVSANSQETDLINLVIPLLWLDGSSLPSETKSEALALLANRADTVDHSIAYSILEGDREEAVYIFDYAVDWEKISSPLARLKVAERLLQFQAFERADRVLAGCAEEFACRNLRKRVRDLTPQDN